MTVWAGGAVDQPGFASNTPGLSVTASDLIDRFTPGFLGGRGLCAWRAVGEVVQIYRYV